MEPSNLPETVVPSFDFKGSVLFCCKYKAAINDEEEQNICCEGRIIIESIDEMLNDLKNFSIHHEVKKHEVQTKYNQVMQLEGESSQPSHVDTSVSEDLKKNDVEDDNICCVCTRNSACKTRVCRCKTYRKSCTSYCGCRAKCSNRKIFK
ncbi:hypothetical protein KFK09_009253 [Dendrobium nobile]|uniref:Tesmin/TSO1-like CXC domain-containing protein n=1 Tax=Dendrobium nobile TaxID=94219 RepID=A0A8T3BRW1_DENNO|nr:hypothetical protein KFK09_009253 [Dendrobium nobile]